MAGALGKSRRLPSLLSSLQSRTKSSFPYARGGCEPWEESVEVDRDPSVARRFGRVLREHKICKSAPEWLPFVPGSCYWLPPEQLTVLPSEAFGYVRELSDSEVRDMMKRLRLTLPRVPVREVVVVVENRDGEEDVDEQLDNIVKSFMGPRNG